MFAFGSSFEVVHDETSFFLKVFNHFGFSLFVLALFKGSSDNGFEVFDEIVKVVNEFLTFAGRDRESQRLAGFVEVVEVEPVVRSGKRSSHALEAFENVASSAGTGLPDDEDVVASAVNSKPELHRLESALLTDEGFRFS